MKAETVPIALSGPAARAPAATLARRWSDLAELAKPRITLMVLVTVGAGAYLAAPAGLSSIPLAATLLGTALLSSAAAALNQALEAREDAQMARTAGRPLAAGRLDRARVAAAAVATSALALALLATRTHPLAAAIGGATLVSYLFLYTPLKKRTPWAALVGAVPGALPPVLGWAAARGELEVGAWVLFGIVFLWQLPHVMAISWMYRDDYRRAGFAVLPLRDPSGTRTALAMVVPALLLVALTTLAPALGVGSSVTVVGGLVAGLGFLAASLAFWRRREHGTARTVLYASIFYLPAVLGAVLIDHLPGLG